MSTSENGIVRQAVVIIHGMGEQRPLETLNGFLKTGLQPDDSGERLYYSRPDKVTDSYESRRYLAPETIVNGQRRAQTEFYEYHWAHLMQGNLLTDLVPPFRRILFAPPWLVPNGLRVVWAVFWGLSIAAVLLLLPGNGVTVDWSGLTVTGVIGALLGGGLMALALTYLVTHVLPHWLTTSFVDVVRYLDTSPRSYAVRKDIRAGIVDLLQGLHDAGRYQRIVIVAHSLGSYIAYDAIGFLWAHMNKLHGGSVLPADDLEPRDSGREPDGLRELEVAASELDTAGGSLPAFRSAQRRLWAGLREQGNPWLITDFVSVGSPMYFADRLYTRNRSQFLDRVAKRELPTCPPLSDRGTSNNINRTGRWFSWNNRGRRVLYEGAPFAVVRWTNIWYPPRLNLLGDWFGGPLQPLFGPGIEDVPVTGDRPFRWIPAIAHALYFSFPDETSQASATARMREAMDLVATAWVQPTLAAPKPDPDTA